MIERALQRQPHYPRQNLKMPKSGIAEKVQSPSKRRSDGTRRKYSRIGRRYRYLPYAYGKRPAADQTDASFGVAF